MERVRAARKPARAQTYTVETPDLRWHDSGAPSAIGERRSLGEKLTAFPPSGRATLPLGSVQM